jgi:hypothetical protein
MGCSLPVGVLVGGLVAGALLAPGFDVDRRHRSVLEGAELLDLFIFNGIWELRIDPRVLDGNDDLTA